MNSFVNVEQSSDPSFWDSYMDSDMKSAPELTTANLQSFSLATGVLGDQLPVFPQQAPYIGLQLKPGVPLESLSILSEASNNITNNLSLLMTTINKTQQEVVNIKKELGEDGLVAATEKSSSKSSKSLEDKRKSQNRAAQRAFRERKEQKLKQLERKLEESEIEKKRILDELEKMKLKNIVMATENQLLKSKEEGQRSGSEEDTPVAAARSEFTFPAVQAFDLDSGSGAKGNVIYSDPEKNEIKLLTIGAVWDYLHNVEELNPNVELDISRIMSELEGSERCHGFGPAYPLAAIHAAICKQIYNQL